MIKSLIFLVMKNQFEHKTSFYYFFKLRLGGLILLSVTEFNN